MNDNTELFDDAVKPQVQYNYSANLSPVTHLAEKRLSTDFCDWSEVTDGLLWETSRQKQGYTRDEEKRERN